MFQSMKKVIVGVVAASLLMTSVAFAADSPTKANTPVDNKKAVTGEVAKGAAKVSVTTTSKGAATVTSVKNNAKTIKVADKVTVDGVEYTVKTIGANAFKASAKKVTTVTLPATVTKISKNAFKNCKKLKKITLKVTKSITVEKGAFKGAKTKDMKIVVSKKMSKKQLNKFKKALTKAGYNGKVVAK